MRHVLRLGQPPRLAFLRLMAAGLLAFATLGTSAALRAEARPEEGVDELVGDLMFHADLMTALDTLCPAGASARDWLSVVRTLPADARTPHLRALSRRLAADAAQAMVQGSGGCDTPRFTTTYAQTRQEYEVLSVQWARLSA